LRQKLSHRVIELGIAVVQDSPISHTATSTGLRIAEHRRERLARATRKALDDAL